MAEKNEKRTPADGMPTSAKDHLKDIKKISIRQETFIFYRSWYECIKAQGPKSCFAAIVAILEYAFYGVDITAANLPKPLEAILSTFTPLIDTNEKKRKGGNKGGDYGYLGGRSKTTKGIEQETPKGIEQETPMGLPGDTPYPPREYVYDNEYDNANVDVDVDVGTRPTPTHSDFKIYIPIFFFRNACEPTAQAQKFYEHYAKRGWRLSGGEIMATDASRIQAAKRWKIKDDPCTRFDLAALHMWKTIYSAAPSAIQHLMVGTDIAFKIKTSQAIITCPKPVSDWIESNAEKLTPTVREWSHDLKIIMHVK